VETNLGIVVRQFIQTSHASTFMWLLHFDFDLRIMASLTSFLLHCNHSIKRKINFFRLRLCALSNWMPDFCIANYNSN